MTELKTYKAYLHGIGYVDWPGETPIKVITHIDFLKESPRVTKSAPEGSFAYYDHFPLTGQWILSEEA